MNSEQYAIFSLIRLGTKARSWLIHKYYSRVGLVSYLEGDLVHLNISSKTLVGCPVASPRICRQYSADEQLWPMAMLTVLSAVPRRCYRAVQRLFRLVALTRGVRFMAYNRPQWRSVGKRL